MTKEMEDHLRAQRARGRKLVVPYVMAGSRDDWLEVVHQLAASGAVDAIEIGIPFSDPVMDGPVIQAAGLEALIRGTTPAGVLNQLRTIDAGVPLAVMTYYNLIFRFGFERLAKELDEAGVAAAILPDLPIEEAGPWLHAAESNGIETVLLVAPNSPDDRVAAITEKAQGFVYAVGTLGVTGERDQLAETARSLASRLKTVTDKPILVGVGVSTPEHALQATETADGVIIGSALVRRLMEGASPEEATEFIVGIRQALDARA